MKVLLQAFEADPTLWSPWLQLKIVLSVFWSLVVVFRPTGRKGAKKLPLGLSEASGVECMNMLKGERVAARDAADK